jgi:UDP-2,3-diacylglucosamine hydrolase
MSDAHLGVASAEHERAFLAWCAAAQAHARSVVINGDLFEFWFEWRHVMPREGYRAVAALAALRDAGVPVLFIGGNHDCWGGTALTETTGVDYRLGSWDGAIGKWRTFIDHGDGLREKEDKRYRMVRPILRHRLSQWAYGLLHPDFAVRLAKATSHTSRNTRPRDQGAGLRSVALNMLAQRTELDLVILGHSHVPLLERASSGGVFANPGAWLDSPTYLVVEDERVTLRRWTGSAEGDRLDAIDRRTEKALAKS